MNILTKTKKLKEIREHGQEVFFVQTMAWPIKCVRASLASLDEDVVNSIPKGKIMVVEDGYAPRLFSEDLEVFVEE